MTGAVRYGGERIPSPALLLGAAGLIPFVVGAALIWWTPGVQGVPVGRVVIVYGAVILSFVGGMMWGLAAVGLAHDPHDPAVSPLLALAVVPSLIGWICVFLPQHVALIALAVAFLAFLSVDRRAQGIGLAPPWWMTLRSRLTAVVVLSLLVAAAEGWVR